MSESLWTFICLFIRSLVSHYDINIIYVMERDRKMLTTPITDKFHQFFLCSAAYQQPYHLLWHLLLPSLLPAPPAQTCRVLSQPFPWFYRDMTHSVITAWSVNTWEFPACLVLTDLFSRHNNTNLLHVRFFRVSTIAWFRDFLHQVYVMNAGQCVSFIIVFYH